MSSNSIRIFVAEDEPLIQQNIIQKIEQISPDFHVIGSAFDGEEALRQIASLAPDILFTDIRMPGIDGLELCEKVKTINPSVRIVIVSGYNEFEYAKTAIRLGVKDYLLKPVKLSVLEEILFDLQEEISLRQSSRERNILASELNGDTPPGLPYTFSGQNFLLFLLCFGSLRTPYKAPAELEAFLQSALCHMKNWWLIDEKNTNRKFLIVKHEQRCAENITDFGKTLYQKLNFCSDLTMVSMKQSISYRDIAECSHKLRRSLHHQLVPGYPRLLLLEERDDSMLYSSFLQTADYKEFTTYIQTENLYGFFQKLDVFFNKWEDMHYPQYLAEKTLLQILHLSERVLEINEKTGLIYEQEIYDLFLIPACYTELCDPAKKLFRTVFLYSSKKTCNTALSIENIKDYLRQNHADAITVDDLASRFNFNSSYLIRAFKKETGQSPMRYLLQIRMENALDLLKNRPDLSIREISALVGYEDQHYFSRLFKKYTEKTPSDYRTN